MTRQIALIACLLLTLKTGSLSAQDRLTNFHVLGVGINKYQDEHIRPLRRATYDVADAAKIFIKQNEFDPVKLLRQSRFLYDDSATKDAIEHELKELPNWVEAGGTLVFIHSGHGFRHGNRWYLSPYDTNVDQPIDCSVSGLSILRAIDALIEARHCRVLLVTDACHSGALVHQAEPLLGKYRGPRQGGLIILASSIPSESSVELQDGGLMISTMTDALRGFAHFAPTDFISLKELRLYLRSGTRTRGLFDWRKHKVPGFPWPEQNFLMEHSLSVSEELGLTKADPKFVFPVGAELPEDRKTAPDQYSVVQSAAPIVGMWLCRRPLIEPPTMTSLFAKQPVYVRGKNGGIVTEDFILQMTENGEYSMQYSDFYGKEKIQTGRYRYVPGVEFSLVYDNGEDPFAISQLDEENLVLQIPQFSLTKTDEPAKEWPFVRVQLKQNPKEKPDTTTPQ